MIRTIKHELKMSPELIKRINFATNYTNIKVDILNGSIITLEPTNIAYVEPHKLEVNNKTFIFFNESSYFFIDDLTNKEKEKNNFIKEAKESTKEMLSTNDNSAHNSRNYRELYDNYYKEFTK